MLKLLSSFARDLCYSLDCDLEGKSQQLHFLNFTYRWVRDDRCYEKVLTGIPDTYLGHNSDLRKL